MSSKSTRQIPGQAAGRHYAVAAGCEQAAMAAQAVLSQGGNVVDAAVAAAAASCVAMPHMTGLGGDLFALVAMQGQPVIALNASGAAPMAASISAYRERGFKGVPVHGGLSVQTPGLPAGLDALVRRWGSLPLAQLLQPAIQLACNGVPVGARLAASIAVQSSAFAKLRAWNLLFCPKGLALRAGDRLLQPALGQTLTEFAAAGAEGLLRGWVGKDIEHAVQEAGGLLVQQDLIEARAEFCEPLVVEMGDVRVLSQPPISAGFVLLRALALAAANDHKRGSVSAYSAVRALEQAFAERLEHLRDGPDAQAIASRLLGEPTRQAAQPKRSVAHEGGDTTTLAIMDTKGNAVSLILSIYADFGSGVVGERSGVLLNNRLSAFFLDERRANALAPGRRSMHTLHSFMVQDESGIRWAGGSPGADNQPQANMHVLRQLLLNKAAPADAVNAPRWAIAPGTDPQELANGAVTHIQYEPDLDLNVLQQLQGTGYPLKALPTASIGSSKLVGRLSNGGVGAWVDGRRQGAVVAV